MELKTFIFTCFEHNIKTEISEPAHRELQILKHYGSVDVWFH